MPAAGETREGGAPIQVADIAVQVHLVDDILEGVEAPCAKPAVLELNHCRPLGPQSGISSLQYQGVEPLGIYLEDVEGRVALWQQLPGHDLIHGDDGDGFQGGHQLGVTIRLRHAKV